MTSDATEEDFGNSRPLDLHRTSSYAEVERCVAALLSELYENVPKRQRATAIQHLKTVVMDLYAVSNVDPQRWLGLSRRPKWYRAIPKRYNALELSGGRIVSLIDRLRAKGLVDFQPGFRAAHKKDEQGKLLEKKYKKGRLSRMRATSKLIELLQRCGVQPHMAELCDCEEVIVLRAAPKEDEERGAEIHYTDTPTTRRMRKDLQLINERLPRHWIDLHILDWDVAALNEELKRKKDSMPFEPSRTRLRRIFNNADKSFRQGGRFYGAWWQEIPNRKNAWRKHITIDGRPTHEIDFSGMHIRMLYAKAGKPMPDGDPYALEGYSANVRKFLKVSFNTMINASNEDEAIYAIMDEAEDWELPELPSDKESVRRLIGQFADKHKAIAHYFYKGEGIRLQYIDSLVAEDVMLILGDMGTPVLPLHDSFIVVSKFSDMLADIMVMAFDYHCKTAVEVKLTNSANDEQFERLEEWRQFQRTMTRNDEEYESVVLAKAEKLKDEEQFYSEYNERGTQWMEATKTRKGHPYRNSGRLQVYIDEYGESALGDEQPDHTQPPESEGTDGYAEESESNGSH